MTYRPKHHTLGSIESLIKRNHFMDGNHVPRLLTEEVILKNTFASESMGLLQYGWFEPFTLCVFVFLKCCLPKHTPFGHLSFWDPRKPRAYLCVVTSVVFLKLCNSMSEGCLCLYIDELNVLLWYSSWTNCVLVSWFDFSYPLPKLCLQCVP